MAEAEMEQYVSQPAFVSVFGKDSNHRCLLLPPRFVENYAERVSRDCRIRGPDGVEWNATVGGAGLSSIGMREGWSNFAVAYGLEAGEVLVVRLVEESLFQVEIFGARCRVNKIPLKSTAATSERGEGRRLAQDREEEERRKEPVEKTRGEEKKKRETRKRQEERVELISVDEQETIVRNANQEQSPGAQSVKRGRGRSRKTPAATPPPASAAPPSTSLVVYDSNKRKRSDESLSRRRPVTEAERERALELAGKFTSENPFSVVVMKRSHVYCGFWMGMKKAFAKEHLPSRICDIVLVDENGDRWGARYLGPRHGISGGWRKFALDHSLEEGDVVVFERIDRAQSHPVVQVHIFRVVELDED